MEPVFLRLSLVESRLGGPILSKGHAGDNVPQVHYYIKILLLSAA